MRLGQGVEDLAHDVDGAGGREAPDGESEELYGDAEDRDEFYREATVWVDGLDRIHKLRGINFCLLRACRYFSA